MAQIFHPSTNTISKLSIVFVLIAVPALSVAAYAWNMTYGLNLDVPLDQPVQFSHKHHVKEDGIDCRYCHSSVENSSFAGIPATETCMTCHSQIWRDSPMLEPVRASYANNQPLRWNRVHDLPHYVYFDHSIHVHFGVGCSTCHGRVDQMPLTQKTASLQMSWCLDCHRAPEKFVRPRDEVFNMAWNAPDNQIEQ